MKLIIARGRQINGTKHNKYMGKALAENPHYQYCIKSGIQDDNTMLVLTRKIPTLSMINLPTQKQAQANL